MIARPSVARGNGKNCPGNPIAHITPFSGVHHHPTLFHADNRSQI
jgi:hypothetical protein